MRDINMKDHGLYLTESKIKTIKIHSGRIDIPINAVVVETYEIPHRYIDNDEEMEDTDYLVIYKWKNKFGYATEDFGEKYGFDNTAMAFTAFLNVKEEFLGDWGQFTGVNEIDLPKQNKE